MPERANPPLPPRTRDNARKLREIGTDAERTLWYRLRAGRLSGFKFRRQHPVSPYVVDFYCDEAKLAVELDGSQHDEATDHTRTRALERAGCKVLRFWDDEVLMRTDDVLEAILKAAQERTLTPDPSPGGRGEKSESLP